MPGTEISFEVRNRFFTPLEHMKTLCQKFITPWWKTKIIAIQILVQKLTSCVDSMISPKLCSPASLWPGEADPYIKGHCWLTEEVFLQRARNISARNDPSGKWVCGQLILYLMQKWAYKQTYQVWEEGDRRVQVLWGLKLPYLCCH